MECLLRVWEVGKRFLSGQNQDIKTGSCCSKCIVTHQWITQIGPVSVYSTVTWCSVKPMIHGPICRIRHVGYDKICGCLIVYHPLKHHATPSDNVVRKIGRVQFSSDSNQLCRMGKPIKWQVFVHVVMFMFLCVCPRADMFPHARCKYGLTRVEN